MAVHGNSRHTSRRSEHTEDGTRDEPMSVKEWSEHEGRGGKRGGGVIRGATQLLPGFT